MCGLFLRLFNLTLISIYFYFFSKTESESASASTLFLPVILLLRNCFFEPLTIFITFFVFDFDECRQQWQCNVWRGRATLHVTRRLVSHQWSDCIPLSSICRLDTLTILILVFLFFLRCATCGAGSYVFLNASNSTCEICPAGRRCDGRSTTVICDSTYSNPGNSKCRLCPDGTYLTTTLPMPCYMITCRIASCAATMGLTTTVESDDIGQVSPVLAVLPDTQLCSECGAVNDSRYVCGPGEYKAGSQCSGTDNHNTQICEVCPQDTWHSDPLAKECTPCRPNSDTRGETGSSTDCICSPGYSKAKIIWIALHWHFALWYGLLRMILTMIWTLIGSIIATGVQTTWPRTQWNKRKRTDERLCHLQRQTTTWGDYWWLGLGRAVHLYGGIACSWHSRGRRTRCHQWE